MKKRLLLILLLLGFGTVRLIAQSEDAEQLILDYEKLSELKSILNELYRGYQILNSGYETIRSIAEDNYHLHNGFLSALLGVSPAVKNYRRLPDIVSDQSSIVSEIQLAFSRFKQDKHFTTGEIAYLGTVYSNLLSQSSQQITELTSALESNLMRMRDDERLHVIDGVYGASKNQLLFLRSFNNSTTMLAIDRATELNDAGTALKLYGLQ
jgi:hypothetical protein